MEKYAHYDNVKEVLLQLDAKTKPIEKKIKKKIHKY